MRLRLSTRKLLLAIAIIALVLVARKEWRLRGIRDRWVAGAHNFAISAAEHEGQEAVCRANQRKLIPYNYGSREQFLNRFYYLGMPPSYSDWAEEAEGHVYWARYCREMTEQFARDKREIERRMLFP